jgi:hypothetical protein
MSTATEEVGSDCKPVHKVTLWWLLKVNELSFVLGWKSGPSKAGWACVEKDRLRLFVGTLLKMRQRV